MKDLMEYKGYLGSARYHPEDRVFFGKVEYVRSLVSYEGRDVDSLEEAFREAVDDYLELCEELGRKPDKPFKGTFNVRTGQERHRRASIFAVAHDMSLNQVVNEALDSYLEKEERRGSSAR